MINCLVLEKLIKKVCRFTITLMDSTILLFPRSLCSDSLLLIRIDNIGDYILWLDAAKNYRKLYPDKHIVLVANSSWSELAERFDYWDEVWPVCCRRLVRNPLYRWIFMLKLYRFGFEIAIHPTYSRSLMYGDSLIRASGALFRFGSSGNLSNMSNKDRNLSNKWYTKLFPAVEKPLMELERNIEFSRAMGFSDDSVRIPFIPSGELDVSRFKLPINYFVVFPGASSSVKMWPVKCFADVARFIYERTGWTMVVCGTHCEKTLGADVIYNANIDSFDLIGMTSLPEFVEVVRGARLLIGNDTSAVHIAAAVRTESVCVFGDIAAVHYGRFLPYPTKVSGLKPIPVYKPSLTSVTVESVNKAVSGILIRI